MHLEDNLLSIRNDLLEKRYKIGSYRTFVIYEPKERIIMALPFRDRVVQHALCNVIEPIFEKSFIFDSYACRIGKGTHRGADRVTEFLQKCDRIWERTYCLKGDIAHYFPSVDRGILLNIIQRKIGCKDTMWLIEEVIYSTGEEPKGLPIGNLTSQLFANIYLNELDHFIKQKLRLRFYVRYMDDFVLLLNDKGMLHEVKKQIVDFLSDKLELELNHKTSIFPVSQGINFLGYRIWKDYRLLRKENAKKMKRRLKAFECKYREGRISLEEIRQSLMSWLGHVSHCNSYNLRRKLLSHFVLTRESHLNHTD